METGKEAAKVIEAGQVYLGIEFGSTRIKAVLTDKDGKVRRQADTAGKTDWKTESGRIPKRTFFRD